MWSRLAAPTPYGCLHLLTRVRCCTCTYSCWLFNCVVHCGDFKPKCPTPLLAAHASVDNLLLHDYFIPNVRVIVYCKIQLLHCSHARYLMAAISAHACMQMVSSHILTLHHALLLLLLFLSCRQLLLPWPWPQPTSSSSPAHTLPPRQRQRQQHPAAPAPPWSVS